MATTQKDIAKRLNLSQSTITKVLNKRPGVWVSDENRRKIEEVAVEMNYRPNAAARALRDGRYRSVTLLYIRPERFDLRSSYNLHTEVLAERLAEIGYELKMKVFPNQAHIMAGLKDLTYSPGTDMVILLGSEEQVEEQGCFLETTDLPFMVKGRFEREHPHWLQVDFDHEQMMAVAVRHLALLGHRRIAYLGNDEGAVYNTRLLEGYRGGMQERRLPTRPEWIAQIQPFRQPAELAVSGWLTLAAGEEPTALVMGTGHLIWYGVEAALARKGMTMGDGPGEFSVAGNSANNVVLSFGQASAFTEIGFEELATAAYDQILLPTLTAQVIANPVVRVLPTLWPIESLDQLQYVTYRQTS